ncbi:MAG TPA: hypothetical protein VM689_20595 [Aliidongia sp.]|nr:hypothetical protein [Aliidongia sp.]
MPDFTVTLGGFAFQNFEVPNELPFGGAQAITTHKLIGGGRVIDAMGRDDARLAWSGTFLSPDADLRARSLDALRVAGAPLALVWNAHRYLVVIQSFSPVYRRASEVPYRIACEIIQDQTQPALEPPESPDADFNTGLADAGAALPGNQAVTGIQGFIQNASPAAQIGFGTVQQATSTLASVVSPGLDTVRTVLGVAGSIGGAGAAQLSQISGVIAQGQTALTPLADAQDGFLGSLPALGAVVPGATPAANAASMIIASAAAAQLPQLIQVGNALANMVKAIGRQGP